MREGFFFFFCCFFSPLYFLFYGPLTCLAFLTITIFTYMTKQLPNIQRGKRSLFPVRSVRFLPVNRQAFVVISLELHNILQQVINKLKVMGSSVMESEREVWFLSPCSEELRRCSSYLQRLSSPLRLNLIPEPLPPSTLPKNFKASSAGNCATVHPVLPSSWLRSCTMIFADKRTLGNSS